MHHCRLQCTARVLGVILALCLTGCNETPQALLHSARSFMEKNDHRAAIIQIKNALQTDPNLAEARFLLGTALLAGGDGSGAETELRKAMQLHYPNDLVLPALARAVLMQDQAARVVDEFSSVQLATAQSQSDLLLSVSGAYAMQEQPTQSEAALSAALQADPGYPPAQMERARRLAVRGDIAGAQSLVDAALARAPQDSEAWKLKGDLDAVAPGGGKQAEAAYRRAIAIKPDDLQAHSALVLWLLQQAQLQAAARELAVLLQLDANHPHTQYLAALLAYQQRDYSAASEMTQRALGQVPGNVAVLELAGASALQLNRLPQAQSYLSKALEAAPALPLARRLLVVTYLRQQQTAKALQALLPGLRQQPADSGLLALAGEVYFRNGDLDHAQQYFSQASANNPKDGRLRTSLAVVGMLHSPKGVELQGLRDISASDSGTTADMVLISSLVQLRDYPQALQAIDVLEKKLPRHPLAAYLQGRVYLARGEAKEAQDSLQRALTLDPTYFPAIASLADMELANKRPEAARQRMQELLQKQPNHLQARIALADIAARTGSAATEVAQLYTQAVSTHPESVDARLAQVDWYLRSHDFKNATAAAQNAVAALPDEPRIVDLLGRSLQGMGDTNLAHTTYLHLAELMPQSALPYWRMADTQLGAHDREGAIQSLQKALAIQPDFLDAQRALIGLYMLTKHTELALALARKVQAQRTHDDAGYIMEADILASSKEWERASAVLQAGLRQMDTTPLAMKLHTNLQAAGKNQEAERFSTQWQQDHPQDAAFFFYLGDQALARKSYAIAEQYFSRVRTLQPENPMVLNNLAWVGGKLKNEGAIALAEKAVALAPQQATFMDTLAALYSEQGNYMRAVELQNRAIELQPQNPLLKLNLAIIHLRGGNPALGQKSLTELNALGDKFASQPEVQALQQQIARSKAAADKGAGARY